jgi:twitching motility protein PilT
MQRGAVAGAFRTIPFKIHTFDELGLPGVVETCPSGRVAWCW